MNIIKPREFDLPDEELKSISVYRGQPFRYQRLGLEINDLTGIFQSSVRDFLERYNGCSRYLSEDNYSRIDILPDFSRNLFQVIEVNTLFPDGWGIALLLSRLAGYPVKVDAREFPRQWFLPERFKEYRGEFELSLAELSRATGVEFTEKKPDAPWQTEDEIFCFGKWTLEDLPYMPLPTPGPRAWDPRIVPSQEFALEDKHHIASFSGYGEDENKVWDPGAHHGRRSVIHVPFGYSPSKSEWEAIPRSNVIFKFRDKESAACERARRSVFYPGDVNDGKFIRRCWRENRLVGQEWLRCHELDGQICQIQLLAHGTKVIAGYCIFAPIGTKILNDSWYHAPLIITGQGS
jgi:hypothetical protein